MRCLYLLLPLLLIALPLSADNGGVGITPEEQALILPIQSEDQIKLTPVKHIIIFYLENHSFDNLFGTFPGADGLANAGEKTVQADVDGKPYKTLPAVMSDKKPDPRFPDNLPNKPFLISQYVPANEKTGDLVHRFYQLQAQMDGGKMDKFAVVSDAGGLTMGYYDAKDSPIWQYAKKYTLADHFFTAAFGGSYLNHLWLICACTPHYADAPDSIRAKVDEKGNLIKDAPLTPDGYSVNTIEPLSPPYNKKAVDAEKRLPSQTMPTIGDRLSEKHIDWVWYSGGWRDADAGNPDKSFIYHHQPFAYFTNYAAGTQARKEHLKDESDFVVAIKKGDLPPVSFYKPIGEFDLHPGYSNLKNSQEHVLGLISKIEHSALWKDSVIIVTFDDAGGFFDHVMPPKGDRFGPGERVPTLIISPFAKHGFIDHTTYDTTSILKFIESRFGLEPLADRDAKANNLGGSLEFRQ